MADASNKDTWDVQSDEIGKRITQQKLEFPNVIAAIFMALADAYAPGRMDAAVNIDITCTYKDGYPGGGYTYELSNYFPKGQLFNVHQFAYRGIDAGESLWEPDELNDWSIYYPERHVEMNVLADTVGVKGVVGADGNLVTCFIPPNDKSTSRADLEAMGMYAYYLVGTQVKTAAWCYAAAALDIAGPNGCALLLMPTSALVQARGAEDRRGFVTKGYIRAVIHYGLLEGDRPSSDFDACIVVLTRSNDSVAFVDAAATLGSLTWSETDRDELARLFREPRDIPHAKATLADIEARGWCLQPGIYVGSDLFVVDGTRLGDIAEIRRGGTKKGALYNPWHSGSDAVGLYFDASMFRHGEVCSADGFAITKGDMYEFDPASHGRSAISAEKDCLFIGRIGTPTFKVGLWVGVSDDDCVPFGIKKYLLVSDSIIPLVPSDDVNPYYLLAFLCTDAGQRLLTQVASGVSHPQLSTRNLREVRIPVPPREEQDAVERQYRAWLRERRELDERIKQVDQERRNPAWLVAIGETAGIDSTYSLLKDAGSAMPS